MKRQIQFILTASTASILACSALAQYPISPQLDQSDHLRQPMNHPRAERLNAAAKASDLIGMTVKNYQDEKLGKVDDLAVDVESGRVVQVILSTGGFLGMGDSLTAVPPGALHHDAANKIIHLDITQEKLKSAPRFDTAKWDEGTESNRVTETYAYYDQEPYFMASREATGIPNPDVNFNAPLPRNLDGTINTDGSRTVDQVRNAERARNVEENSNSLSTRNPDGTWTRVRYANGYATNSSWPSLGSVHKASQLIGTAVNNRQDERLGKVENIMVDLASGRIVAVIISSGGFIGMGDALSAVPPAALRFNAENNTIELDASKEMLASSPHFKASEWPNLSEPAYVGGVYRAYKVDPYFTTDGTAEAEDVRLNDRDRDQRALTARDRALGQTNVNADADNTRQNVRDRDSRTLTPLDQGNSQADLYTTAQIRKEIIAEKGMTVNARNVKIITKNGQVTLRGPVNTTQEKFLIGEIAKRIASSANVNNQLEVARTTTPVKTDY